RQPGPTEFHNQCGGIVRSGKSGELQDAGVKNELQGKVWPGARKFRGVCLRRTRWLASRSRTFRRCACAPPPAPVEAETAELCRELLLFHTYCKANLRKPSEQALDCVRVHGSFSSGGAESKWQRNSNHRSVRDDGVFGNDDDAVADVTEFVVELFGLGGGRNLHVVSDARVLVNDGVFDLA